VPRSEFRNRLLQALPAETMAELWPLLEPVQLTLLEVLQVPEQPMPGVWFVETDIVSMIATLDDGDGAEVGLVGNDGMVGLPLLLADDRDDLEAIVQMAGTGFRIPTLVLQDAVDRLLPLRRLLSRYALLQYGQVARTAACNGRHHVDQRLARWLLMADDRTQGDILPFTHEMLAMMLAVRRAGVSVAAGALQKAGLIQYSGGRITITDRPGLEPASRGCYATVRRATDRLFGFGRGETS
jgi:CRP-like cAMP-binding protein